MWFQHKWWLRINEWWVSLFKMSMSYVHSDKWTNPCWHKVQMSMYRHVPYLWQKLLYSLSSHTSSCFRFHQFPDQWKGGSGNSHSTQTQVIPRSMQCPKAVTARPSYCRRVVALLSVILIKCQYPLLWWSENTNILLVEVISEFFCITLSCLFANTGIRYFRGFSCHSCIFQTFQYILANYQTVNFNRVILNSNLLQI